MAQETDTIGISIISVIGYITVLHNGNPSDFACVGLMDILWICRLMVRDGARGGAFGLGTALQPGKLRLRLSIESLWPWGRLSL